MVNRMVREREYLDVVRDTAAVFGAQVRAARTQRRWTAAQLGRRAGVTKATVLKIEHGDLRVSLGLALQVGALVGISFYDTDERGLAAGARSVAAGGVFGRRVRPPADPETDLDF